MHEHCTTSELVAIERQCTSQKAQIHNCTTSELVGMERQYMSQNTHTHTHTQCVVVTHNCTTCELGDRAKHSVLC